MRPGGSGRAARASSTRGVRPTATPTPGHERSRPRAGRGERQQSPTQRIEDDVVGGAGRCRAAQRRGDQLASPASEKATNRSCNPSPHLHRGEPVRRGSARSVGPSRDVSALGPARWAHPRSAVVVDVSSLQNVPFDSPPYSMRLFLSPETPALAAHRRHVAAARSASSPLPIRSKARRRRAPGCTAAVPVRDHQLGKNGIDDGRIVAACGRTRFVDNESPASVLPATVTTSREDAPAMGAHPPNITMRSFQGS